MSNVKTGGVANAAKKIVALPPTRAPGVERIKQREKAWTSCLATGVVLDVGQITLLVKPTASSVEHEK